jgi:O-methyltransferase involved in polyketide biosynthesis
MVRMIDYDFESLRGFGNRNFLVARAKQFDDWTKEFLRLNPEAVVLNLGCGLDSRVSRIGPPSGVEWFDIDYPGVILERRKFFSEGEGYEMLGYSLTDPEWLERVPRDRPAMVVADGVLEYLTEEDVRALFNRATDRLFRGQVVFDVMSSFAVTSGRSNLKAKTGAEMRWAVDDVSAVGSMDQKLKLVSDLSLFRSGDLPAGCRLLFRAFSAVPRFRDMIRLLRYELG